ncbi:helix-turn-helix domain-containing protein [Parachitinimonas caeni]|uniref:Helix-turn-helix transcriptional regulator n=1 Tax=Parachitinimonas caeni TaxID=3031301 RepID=A0ABT7E0R5_9NEIS|nr:helix-turn-helix transcriptional regulator [Parachitinimonas caeni]MDK2125916.1 helix-turn-helix transcriptional regulator [Parachitinimonas caeni]
MSKPSNSTQAEQAPLAAFKYGPRRLALNVRVLMAERGYKSVTTLYRDLAAMGCEISYAQFTRIVDNRAEKLNTDVLDALLNLFNCSISELFIEQKAPTT